MNLLLRAMHFAATKHTDQRRKNSAASPYINHPIEVAEHLNAIGKIDDTEILIAALLHDTIEDTATTQDEIRELFGATVLELVLECTDDKSLEKAERKRLQIVNAPHKSDGAKQIKIADKTCNLKSLLADPPKGWSIDRQREYIEWSNEVYCGLKGVNDSLDAEIERVIARGLAALTNDAE